ncbi:MAG: hypothetical protein U5K43_01645 [Halofilum sp. (in: g-proteobacteria)]|nr:hypothetical protein [Halofilum sp. (in: g-proteobacteria)]
MISETIALIHALGCAKEGYRPVTMEGMTQLANLTFELFHTESDEIGFAAEEVRRDVGFVAKSFLNVPEPPLAT